MIVHAHVNSFKETRQSKQLHPKTTPFTHMCNIHVCTSLHTCVFCVYIHVHVNE